MFYFEANTKNFHYVDIYETKPEIKTIKLNINFYIPEGHRSILTENGKILLLGGYNKGIIDEEN